MSTASDYHKRFIIAIKKMSVHPERWKEEWRANAMSIENPGYCICGKDIYTQFPVYNEINGKRIWIGADCYATHFENCITCTRCGCGLLNKVKRLREKNMLCRECTKKSQKEKEMRLIRLGCTIYQPIGKYIRELDTDTLTALYNSSLKDKNTLLLREYVDLLNC